MPSQEVREDPLDTMGASALEQKHPELIAWEAALADYNLLYRGGREFISHAGDSNGSANPIIAALQAAWKRGGHRKRRFLHQLQSEPDTKYQSRLDRAYYINYIGAIVDYFRHYLFSQPPVIRPINAEAPPAWWSPFHVDCTGGGIGLLDFAKHAFLPTLIGRRAGWLISRPLGIANNMTEAQASEVSAAGVELVLYETHQIRDWQYNQSGDLDWILLERCESVRQFPFERAEVKTYTYADRERSRTWIKRADMGLEVVDDNPHGLGEVPFVELAIPHGMWILDKLASWQIDLFNKMNMLSYGELMACFVQPYIKTNDPNAKGRIFGEGVLLDLRAGTDKDKGEEFGYASPDVAPMVHAATRCREQRDEGYRIVHQMSLAVDSQAIGAIARSGASKIEDRRAAEIILAGYGTYVKDALIRTANLVSRIKGDDTEWQCIGFDRFQVSSLEEELSSMALVKTFGIKSRTFNELLDGQIATGNVLRNIDEASRTAILEEIKENYDEEEELAELEAELDPLEPQGDEDHPSGKTGEFGEDSKTDEDGNEKAPPFGVKADKEDELPQAKGKPPFLRKKPPAFLGKPKK